MKKLIFLLLAVLSLGSISAQTTQATQASNAKMVVACLDNAEVRGAWAQGYSRSSISYLSGIRIGTKIALKPYTYTKTGGTIRITGREGRQIKVRANRVGMTTTAFLQFLDDCNSGAFSPENLFTATAIPFADTDGRLIDDGAAFVYAAAGNGLTITDSSQLGLISIIRDRAADYRGWFAFNDVQVIQAGGSLTSASVYEFFREGWDGTARIDTDSLQQLGGMAWTTKRGLSLQRNIVFMTAQLLDDEPHTVIWTVALKNDAGISSNGLKIHSETKHVTIFSDLVINETNDIRIVVGSGTPEAAITAGMGSTYHNILGGANTSFYVKEVGTGNTGWVAK